MAYKYADTPSAVGEIYSDKQSTIGATASAEVAKGDVVIFSAGKVAKADDGDNTGIYGVAHDAIAQNAEGRVVIEGDVSVASTAAVINVGDMVMASATAGKVCKLDADGIKIGFALTPVTSAGGNLIIRLGA